MRASPVRGLISQVQRFCIHDGPGIRTTVFLKGCPLRCFWCHNPETWQRRPELQCFPERCIACGACLEGCPERAHVLVDGAKQFRRERCRGCGLCAEACYAGALVLVGRWWTAEDLLAELLRDRAFYEESGGGITLSGGEPLLQQAFSLQVLQLCKGAGLHTAMETSAIGPWRKIVQLLPYLDLVMVDLKHPSDAAHRAATGVSNRSILANVRLLAETGVRLIVRTPVVPGVNDTPEAIGTIAGLICTFASLQYYELIPFHRLAEGKYRSLGLEYRARDIAPPAPSTLEQLAQVARDQGVRDVRVS